MNVDAQTRRRPAWLSWSLATIVLWGMWGLVSKIASSGIDVYVNQLLYTVGLVPLMVFVAWTVSKRSAGDKREGRRKGIFWAFLTGILGGLGNLAFYDTMPPETYSGALHITITGRHVDGFSWRPAEISGGLPIQETGSAAAEAIARWKRLRGCTDLSLTPGTALATADSETKSFTGPYIHPLGG